MENDNGLGCVYFVKLNGLAPIKIGYSTNPTPQGRLESFAVGSPYGIELVCFFQSTDAKKHETLLHKRFASFRIRGEWFEITKEQARSACAMFMSEQHKDLLSVAYEKISSKISGNVVHSDVYPSIFSEWMTSNVEFDVKMDKYVLRQKYLDDIGISENELSQKKTTVWVNEWVKNNHLRCYEGKSGHVRWIVITK